MDGTHNTGTKNADISIGKSEQRRLLGRLRHRWNNNIKMNLKEIRFEVWTVFIQLKTGGSGGLL